jgi:ribonuclease BN (tRNA processing enzyme)
MEITFLGTAGWMPNDQRETASIAVRVGSSLILLDAGTGIRRLVTDPALHGGVESIHVMLSHFHLDHVVGLSYLSALPEEIPSRSAARATGCMTARRSGSSES